MIDPVEELQATLERREREVAEREAQLERYAADLRVVFQQERERADEVRRAYAATVRALATAVEARDTYTGKHAERVAAYALEIAHVAGIDIAGSPEIEFGFLLHDVGKVAIPDAILFKAARLTDEEYSLMTRHTVIGWDILRDVDFLGEAKLVVRHHHERFDGSGYPDGLVADDIPLAARVFAVADALDALTSDRPYRRASSLCVAREEIRRGAGTQFCPTMVDAFRRVDDDVLRGIRERIG